LKISLEYTRCNDPDSVLQVSIDWSRHEHVVELVISELLYPARLQQMSGAVAVMRRWCIDQFGLRGESSRRTWNYRHRLPYGFAFATMEQAFAFKTRWHGVQFEEAHP
jgi:hypothetical protein